MARKPLLTPPEIEWAHRKWCEGYTLEQIANALHCCTRTLEREFAACGLKRVRIPLKYPED